MRGGKGWRVPRGRCEGGLVGGLREDGGRQMKMEMSTYD